MTFNKNRPVYAAALLMLVVVLLFGPTNTTKAGPVAAVIFVVVAITGVVVADYFMCGFNIFFYCKSNGGGGSKNPWNGGSSLGDTNGGKGGKGGGGNGGNGGNGGGGSVPVACVSDKTNACGQVGVGFEVNGVCSATVPSNSSCPAPGFGDKGFYADPDRVRSGDSTTLHWDVTDATICSLTGGGISLNDLGVTGSKATNTVTEKTLYSLTCQNGDGGPKTSKEATVSLIPTFQEI